MDNSGFIYKEEESEFFRVDMTKLDALYELSERDLQRQVDIAEKLDGAAAADYLSYAKEIPEIQDIIATVSGNK